MFAVEIRARDAAANTRREAEYPCENNYRLPDRVLVRLWGVDYSTILAVAVQTNMGCQVMYERGVEVTGSVYGAADHAD